MWESLKKIILIVLAVLGVLFLILLFLPDDEDEDYDADDEQVEIFEEETDPQPAIESEAADTEDADEEAPAASAPAPSDEADSANTATVNIPANELSSYTLSFKTSTLDNKIVDQDIFSPYDITIVHVWGTYCTPCLSEIGDYAALYDSLPDNINLIGIVVDIYDGLDNNVSKANDILSNAGAKFTNLKVSDDVYEITEQFQYIPSSFFVDSEGHVIGDVMEDAFFDETKARLAEYID